MNPRRAIAIALAGLVLAPVLGAAPWTTASGQTVRETVASGLEFPVSFAFVQEDGSSGFPAGTILYSERFTGNVRAIIQGQVRPDPVVTVNVVADGEQGLLGLALDPSFGTRPWVYLYHTYRNVSTSRDENRVVRWWLGPTIPPSGPFQEVVLDPIPASTIHDGGILGFAPDGTLFITTGDASVADNAQDNASLSGKVLRINPDGSIPADNPIPGSPVYTLGHRNVFGLAFHPATGVAYVSENGPSDSDEVNRLEPGRNYGWPVVRGDANDPRFVDPVTVYETVIAPTGVAFYTGTVTPALTGGLFLGDWNRGVLQRLVLGGVAFDTLVSGADVLSVGPYGILDLEDGPDGSLYFSTGNAIYRMGEGSGPGPIGPGVVVVLAVVAAVAALFAFALWREQRRRSTPRPPAAPPPP